MIGYLTPNYPLVAAFRSLPKTRTRPADPVSQRIFKLAPKLADYFRDGEYLAAKGDLDRPISGLALDSRRVMPGNVFFALRGRRADGSSFIDEAIQRGAVAIVGEKIPSGTATRVTYIQVTDVRRTLALVSQRYYGFADRSLEVVGVTGTSGKTTVSTLIRHLLATPVQRVGLLGTIHYDLGARTVPSYRTTPESLDLHGMLAQMRDAGCRQAAMEVSFPGIDQRRVAGTQFAVGVFTNASAEHAGRLDEFFGLNPAAGPAPRAAAINLDETEGRRLAASLPAGMKVVTFGEAADAMVRAEEVVYGFEGTALRLVWPQGSLEVVSPLIGRINLSNLLAAFAACYALGRDPSVIAARLRSFGGVAGRFERVEDGQPFNVLVDYAHTAEALRASLAALRPLTPGRLLVVFGCGGNRDRSKRASMTQAVQQFADFAWATADNPRGEGMGQIFSDMRADLQDGSRITFVDDRRRGISLALAAARPGDCVVIAGKGHETFQEIAGTVVPFDDRQVAREFLGSKSQSA
jgi:UDP-N-acetylmuramoyl-L-alanyl-D-glutamate--2,6-diaminopimelate ligase